MEFPFRIEKAIESVGVLLSEQTCHTMEYLRLLKLLYIAEREAILETGIPIVGSRLVAMRQGPLHSRVYDLIKSESHDKVRWARYFETSDINIGRVEDPGVAHLSRYEVRKLIEVSERYELLDTWELVEVTHGFTEWQISYPDPEERTSRPIQLRTLLEANGRESDFAELQERCAEIIAADAVFS